jgi:hypothetical protein
MRHTKRIRKHCRPSRRSFGERLHLSRIFSQTAEELGHNNEKRVVEAYTKTDGAHYAEEIPPWIQSVRLGTKEEDKIGVDVVFNTEIGAIFVQVKGCALGVHNFNLQHSRTRAHIKVISVIIYPAYSPDTIRRILNPLLWKEFSRLSLERRSWSLE